MSQKNAQDADFEAAKRASVAQLLMKCGRLLNERGPFYAEAQVRVKSNEGPHADTAQAILRAIEDYLS